MGHMAQREFLKDESVRFAKFGLEFLLILFLIYFLFQNLGLELE